MRTKNGCHRHLAQFYYLMHISSVFVSFHYFTGFNMRHHIFIAYLNRGNILDSFVHLSPCKQNDYKKIKNIPVMARINSFNFFSTLVCIRRDWMNLKNMLLLKRGSGLRASNAVMTFTFFVCFWLCQHNVSTELPTIQLLHSVKFAASCTCQFDLFHSTRHLLGALHAICWMLLRQQNEKKER